MSHVGTLLLRALSAADRQGDYWLHERHMAPGDFEELGERTRRHAWEQGDEDSERPGWRVLRSGVIGWWQAEADVDDKTRRRLRYLRTDVLRHLAEQGLGWKPYPRSTSVWVREKE